MTTLTTTTATMLPLGDNPLEWEFAQNDVSFGGSKIHSSVQVLVHFFSLWRPNYAVCPWKGGDKIAEPNHTLYGISSEVS